MLLVPFTAAHAATDDEPPTVVREVFVPFDDLHVLLENQPQRVLLSQAAYDDLLKRAVRQPRGTVPHATLPVAADYEATVEGQQAQIVGRLSIDVLEDGLHAVPLELSGVALRRATLDDRPAPLGQAGGPPPGQRGSKLLLFVEGRGRHVLELEMVAPLETSAARQILQWRLPCPPSVRLRLTMPGDVEIRSGAAVISRTVDDQAHVTRFELLPSQADMTLIMWLNSHLQRRQRAVAARSVLVHEITQAYQRLHAAVHLEILHVAVDRFRFVVPEGFEITDVASPLLSRWSIEKETVRRVLSVQLRQPTTEPVLLNLSAIRTVAPPETWSMPRLEALDVVGQASIVGLLVDARLKADSLAPQGLIPVDAAVLAQAVPESVFRAEPGAPPLVTVAAWYAPQPQYALQARITRPAAGLAAPTGLVLAVDDQGPRVRGWVVLTPDAEKLFAFDLTVPAGWQLTAATAPDGRPLFFERREEAVVSGQWSGVSNKKSATDRRLLATDHRPLTTDHSSRVRIDLPAGVAPGADYRVGFEARRSTAGWLGDWTAQSVEFPRFDAPRAQPSTGVIAVETGDDMTVRPERLTQLTPLDDAAKAQQGLDAVRSALAYRCEGPQWQATLHVQRSTPRLTARTFSFLRVEPDALICHHELFYSVTAARARRLSFLLPEATPVALAVRGLDNLPVKQFTSEPAAAGWRRWNVVLEDPRSGLIRLAVDYQQPVRSGQWSGVRGQKAGLSDQSSTTDHRPLTTDHRPPTTGSTALRLPIIRADGVAHQSGLAAVEGNAELDVSLEEASGTARRVDVGELADAEYQPGRRLLAAYGFAAEGTDTKIDLRATVARHAGYALPPALVQNAVLSTLLAAEGVSLNAARFELRTNASFLEVALPPDSTLWSALLDGRPLKPQLSGQSLLVGLPATGQAALRSLQIVYQTPVRRVRLSGTIELPAPALLLRADRSSAPTAVPLANLSWDVALPSGYEPVQSGGTLTTGDLVAPRPAVATVGRWLLAATGGINGPPNISCSAPMGEQKSAAPPTSTAAAPASAFSSGEIGQSLPPPSSMRDDVQFAPADSKLELGRSRKKAATVEGKEQLGERSGKGDTGPAGKDQAGTIIVQEEESVKLPLAAPDIAVRVIGNASLPPRKAAAVDKLLASSLEGVRSLPIELQFDPDQLGPLLHFQSLGGQPRLELTMAHRGRFMAWAWALGLAAVLWGVLLTNCSVRAKARLVLVLTLAGMIVPWAVEYRAMAWLGNALVFAAAALVPYYLAAGAVKWAWGHCCRASRPASAPATVAAATVAVLLLVATCGAAGAQEPNGPQAAPDHYTVEFVPPPPPLKVSDDILIRPYDPQSPQGVAGAHDVLVPYAKYVELWNKTHPDKRIEAPHPPADFALAGAEYRATLSDADLLLVSGRLEIDVFSAKFVTIPLKLEDAVLARAELDGQPAPLAGRPLALSLSGPGRHHLDLDLRLRLRRRGGWRMAQATLPTAPAASLSLAVPQAQTELRMPVLLKRYSEAVPPSLITDRPDQVIHTALDLDGILELQWRPKIAEGQADQSLTTRSTATLDVQDDGLRLQWQVRLEFYRSQRDSFRFVLPAGYLLEKVEGSNVRGWAAAGGFGSGGGQPQRIDVWLLKPARDQVDFTLRLARREAVGRGAAEQFDVPVIDVEGSVLHRGNLLIRRSVLVDLRTVEARGATRTDLEAVPAPALADVQYSPVELRPYQAFQFAGTPFTVRLQAASVAVQASAEVQSLLRISQFERRLESRVVLRVSQRPLFLIETALPDDLNVEQVKAPGDFQWAVTARDKRRVLSVYLAQGQQGEVPLVLRGRLGAIGAADRVPLPRIEVLAVQRQQGQIVAQADPAYDVLTADLRHCQPGSLEEVRPWLDPRQQSAVRAVVSYREPDYAGLLRLVARQAEVSCVSITNVRVTSRAVEETVLLDFAVRNAGVSRLSFLLPAAAEEPQIDVPLLREKTIERTGTKDDPWIRVRLELQDEVMDHICVQVHNDRAPTAAAIAASIPRIETGRTVQRFVTLESGGYDEVEVAAAQGVERIQSQQQAWHELTERLGAHFGEAWAAVRDAQRPSLVFRTRPRQVVETAAARIGLAETTLALDGFGAYRGQVVYQVENTTQQFLDLRLPAGAALWTARVDGEAVKVSGQGSGVSDQEAGVSGQGSGVSEQSPTTDHRPLATDHRPLTTGPVVRIPLLKTAAGDRPYPVVVKYGGSLPELGALKHVDFPLVHTLKVGVQLSHVFLYLPETHDWLHFDGTMRRVDPGQTAREVAVYERNIGQQLVDTLRLGGAFAKARAAHSLQQQAAPSGGLTSYSGIGGLAKESLVDLDALQKELVQQQGQPPAEEDNRLRLGRLQKSRNASLARNSVQSLGENFTVQQGPAAVSGQGSNFNPEWFARNGLANPSGGESGEKSRLSRRQADYKGNRSSLPTQISQQPYGMFGRQSSSAATVYQSSNTGGPLPLAAPAEEPSAGDRSDGRQREVDTVTRYQSRLGDAIAGQAGGKPAGAGENYPGYVEPLGTAAAAGASRPPGKSWGYGGQAAVVAVPPLPPPAATGLASLDIELPHPGRLVVFTTPGGEVEIGAWSLSARVAGQLEHLALALLAVLAAGGLLRALRRGGGAWFGGRWTPAILIVAGLLSIIDGLLPVAGLLALIAGAVLAIRRAALVRPGSKPGRDAAAGA